MTTNLIFQAGMKLFMIRVDGKKIYYNDSVSGLHELYPEPDAFALKVGGEPTEQELKEYEMCKTEDEIISFVLKDCRQKGIKLIRRDNNEKAYA